jgi:hypothetical protein
MIRHFSHIFFVEGLTFIEFSKREQFQATVDSHLERGVRELVSDSALGPYDFADQVDWVP